MTQTDQSTPTTPPAPELTPDILGEPWVARRINVTVDQEAAPGADHAVLVYQRGATTAPRSAPRHTRAVLYLHGRNDYFFQTWLAEAFLDAGYEFYALDLRACGRAGAQHPSPHDVRDLRVHDEEIAESLRIIKEEHGHHTVILNGHSTGGLQAVIWAADHPGSVRALALNSPWLQLNSSSLVRSYGSAYVDLLSRRDPNRIIGNPSETKAHKAARLAAQAALEARATQAETADPAPADSAPADSSATEATKTPQATASDAVAALTAADPGAVEDDLYVRVLHQRWGGEWDWDLNLKASPSFPVRAGFMAGIRRLHREIKHGLDLKVPVLVCCSTTTGQPDATPEEALRSDMVLSVEQMVERSACLGRDVTIRQIPGGVHDLVLSPSPVREDYLNTMMGWLAVRLG
ncbi:Alpha/beta hydrolase family [Actinomyces bovis]|uniref:Alpha/beta hydrolase family n=1 Tax=Actinomyces bovis TaxID=1658 RepID=A0ABY1VQT6_9ACTO|nr:alpha/beta hydrolase [Actinomyces bovis]SPT55042.1 Alpha/beta hydrolase family [Actinomyces bovis]VEG56204.1 Alpha/beta hydrolase family [Actinomyces israelii]